MMQSFEVTFEPAGKGWAATVAQTSGLVVLPPETPVFRGKSLASVEERVSAYLGGLDLKAEWISSYNFAPGLSPLQSHLLGLALNASEAAEEAEFKRIRSAHRAIEELSSSGFSMRDISVLLGESRAQVQEMLRLGRIFEEFESHDE